MTRKAPNANAARQERLRVRRREQALLVRSALLRINTPDCTAEQARWLAYDALVVAYPAEYAAGEVAESRQRLGWALIPAEA